MNEPVLTFDVSIYLRGDDLDPACVSALLGISPTYSQKKGEKSITSTGKEVIAKLGVWAITSETNSGILSDHLDELTSRFQFSIRDLRRIASVQDAYLDVFIATDADESGEGTCDFQLSKENIEFLNALGLQAQFSVNVVKK